MSDSSPAIIALLSACAIFAGDHAAQADDSIGRAILTAPTKRIPPETRAGSLPDAALRATPSMQPSGRPAELDTSTYSKARPPLLLNSAPVASTGPVSKTSQSSVGLSRSTTIVRAGSGAHKMELGNDIDTAARVRTITRVSADGFVDEPANVLPPAVEKSPSPPETWGQEYATHVDDVLTGGACRCEQESVGEWWNRRIPYIEIVTIEPGQLKDSARGFIANHTLPPEHDYDVDIYDQKPIAVASAPMKVLPVQEDEANEDKDSDEPGTSRLKTDIRKIRPTLSYAMRNIKENQLPAGFHEKLDQGEYVARQASPAVLQWAPTNLYYHPLYFEDPSLERYGHTYHPVVQPFASAGRFATQLVGLPYQMALHPVHSREYALGYYRPGECAPKKHYQIPFNEEAAVVQAAAMVGFFLIFP